MATIDRSRSLATAPSQWLAPSRWLAPSQWRAPSQWFGPSQWLAPSRLTVALFLGLLFMATFGAADEPKQAQPKHPPNRLAAESSPYLLQHAHNPVRWEPWDEQALARARREGKLIFLSIGYSSCHWCHVMERESFLDEEIATFLSERFVCIKVDREERPDIDTIYMTGLHVYQRLIGAPGRGGWPLTMFLTPEGSPFFGGTYFPARDGDRGAGPGLLTILRRVDEVWRDSPDKIRRDAEALTRLLKTELETARSAPDFEPSREWLDRLRAEVAEPFDAEYGGFGFVPGQDRSPKFPDPANLLYLLHEVRKLPESERRGAVAERPVAERPVDDPLRMLTETLDAMARGGIRDHIGGGFHRYTVDRRWRVPHFEKMLYDNGLLASVYAEAYAATGSIEYREVVEGIVSFVGRELTSPDGACYSSLDAESEGIEGRYYRWTRDDALRTLGADDYRWLAPIFDFDGPPNFEFEGEWDYVPQRSASESELATAAGSTLESWRGRRDELVARLRVERERRPRPATDTKILTAWNGLMIRGLADSARLLDRPEDLRAATRAAEFVLARSRDDEGRLTRTPRAAAAGDGADGADASEARRPPVRACLDDYAYLIRGLLGLHLASGDARWLDEARRLNGEQHRLFWDDVAGGYYFTPDNHGELLARSRGEVDGALPAASSVAALNLLALSAAAADAEERARLREHALRTIRSQGELLRSAPAASPLLGVAIDQLLE